jgi:hypothetical protein
VNGLDGEPPANVAETYAAARAERRRRWIAECRAAITRARERSPRADGNDPDHIDGDMPARMPETPTGDGTLSGPGVPVDDGRPDGNNDHRT